ncbi:MAG: superinfection immunity protein, partial [Acidimicrobiia bacterium]
RDAGLYLIPSLVAAIRKVPNAGSVFVINLFLGWTLIGWVVALAMAARSSHHAPIQQHLYHAPTSSQGMARQSSGDAAQGSQAATAFCTECGMKAAPGDKFCGKCGTTLPTV